ncbi:MAG: CBS domain-containing protein, partial [Bdellovibrionales bacterium]|nr:CBS domain-containing protein [Bdellovibrionales bacterium]
MNAFDWREKLKVSQQYLSGHSAEIDISDLKKPISSVVTRTLSVVGSRTPLREIAEQLMKENTEFALVQDTPETIQGVLRRDALHAAMVSLGDRFDRMVVANIMDRNVCIEPESATISEVMNRMTFGDCLCTVVVDGMGRPISIISAKAVCKLVQNLFESKS